MFYELVISSNLANYISFRRKPLAQPPIREVHAAVAPDLASIAKQYDDIKQSDLNKNIVKHVFKVIYTTKQHESLATV